MATVGVIGALQLFDQAFIAGGVDGDPNNALMTMVLYLYNAAFTQFNFGYAAAVGIILFVDHLRRDARPAAAVRRRRRHGERRTTTAERRPRLAVDRRATPAVGPASRAGR